jgi:anti-sigma B factor antagonist
VSANQGISRHVRTGEMALKRNDAGLTVLTISGEHDLSTAPELRRSLERLISGGDPIVIDLSPATFVDSSVLGVILDARRRAEEAGLGFAVAHESNGNDAVARVLEITGLRSDLPVHLVREEAVSAASAGSGRKES